MRGALLAIAMYATIINAGEKAPSEFVEKSPTGRFTITQRWVKPDYIVSDTDCNDSDCGWQTVLDFADKSKRDVQLAAYPEWYVWPADYRISPDEQWVIRDQKTGSGENALFLYRITPDGQVWRLAEPIDDVVFAALLAPIHRTRADYYHLQVALGSWDLTAGRVHLKAYATPNNREHELIRARAVIYDLNKHVATPE
jgi:hypothetical protein